MANRRRDRPTEPTTKALCQPPLPPLVCVSGRYPSETSTQCVYLEVPSPSVGPAVISGWQLLHGGRTKDSMPWDWQHSWCCCGAAILGVIFFPKPGRISVLSFQFSCPVSQCMGHWMSRNRCWDNVTCDRSHFAVSIMPDESKITISM